MKAIIMAGGEGSRLRPLTCNRPKPLVSVLNKPIMEYSVELLKKHGIHEIGVTLQYLPHAIIDYFGDGSNWGVKLQYFLEDTPLGTAGSVKNTAEFLDEPFLVISGDALTDFDLHPAIAFHQQNRALATIVLTSVSNPLEYGIVITKKDHKIASFLEKPSWGEVFSDTVNTGIYILQPEVLDWIPEKKGYDFSKDLFPHILKKKGALYGYKAEGYWCDIGDIKQYHQAHMDILDGKVNIDISGEKLATNIWVGKECDIAQDANLEGPLFIDDYVKIAPGVNLGPSTIIGRNCVIEGGSSLKRAVLWNNVYIGKGAEIRGSILLKGTKVKAYGNLFEGVTVGDDCIIEEHAILKPDVKVWPNKMISRGAILTESLVWGTKTARSIFGNQGVTGIANIDITPEFAARLGAAYASSLSKDAQVLVGCEIVSGAKMLRDAFISGLLSSGIQVIDIGESVTPMTRFAVRTIGVNAGVHVKIYDEKITFVFLGNNGANILRNEERKIENIFTREDFRRVSAHAMREKVDFPNVMQSYYQKIFSSFNADVIQKKRLRIFVSYNSAYLGHVIDHILASLGVEIFYFQIDDFAKDDALSKFAEEVFNHKVDFGIMIDAHAEELILVDSSGRVVAQQEYDTLLALVLMTDRPKAKIVVPFHASSAIDKLASKYSGKIIRSKTSLRDWMNVAQTEDVVLSQGEQNQFTLRLDALQAFVSLTYFLAKNNISLKDLLEELPELNYCKKEVSCPWNKKGSVMRRLIEDGQQGKSELLDGVKIFHDDGWVLVLPDNENAVCKVYSEGKNMEVAEELAGIYLDKVKRYSE